MPKRKKIEDRRAVYQLLYDKVPPQQQQQLQQPDYSKFFYNYCQPVSWI